MGRKGLSLRRPFRTANMLWSEPCRDNRRQSLNCFFASPAASPGSKMGIDETDKRAGETTRTWGRPGAMGKAVKQRKYLPWKEPGLRAVR